VAPSRAPGFVNGGRGPKVLRGKVAEPGVALGRECARAGLGRL